MSSAHEHNRVAWDERARAGARHTRSVLPQHLADPMPILDPENWFGPMRGVKVLCLASGGGLQSALLAAAHAEVTVVDISAEMLELDQKVAREQGFNIRTLRASMDDLQPLGDAQFDFVLQPVSTCYTQDLGRVYREVARVLKSGGLYVSQHKQPINLQTSVAPARGFYQVEIPYFHEGPLPAQAEPSDHRENDTIEFLHRWENLLGGLCRSGFVIEDVSERRHANPDAPAGSFAHRSYYIPPYVKIKARRVAAQTATPRLWTP